MTSYRFGDLILVAFPFSSGTEAKQRPALVILDTSDADIIVARVTTQLYQSPYDLLVTEWQRAGLLAPSVIRLHKLATLEKTLIRRPVGQLIAADCQRAAAILQQIVGGT
jgi:mRNA interferase MazF